MKPIKEMNLSELKELYLKAVDNGSIVLEENKQEQIKNVPILIIGSKWNSDINKL
jgi:hypothetical protein